MTDQAMEYYRKIIEFPDNQYTDEALIKAARIEFDNKNYLDAFNDYSKLAKITENQGMRIEGNDGAMRSAYLMEKYKEASDFSAQLLKTEKVSEEQIVFAHYISAKSAFELRDMTRAEKEFEITDNLTSGELGAESKYQLAFIHFQRNELEQAENLIYQIPEQYADFEYWIAKGFILLADIYLERDNAFQAEQTLQSIIDNYPREDLKSVAREKLDEIKKQSEETNE
jgi:tetratricopeptide (TPR) repeat protein